MDLHRSLEANIGPMHWHLTFGFVLAVTPICLTPGASFTLVTQRVATGRRRDGLLVAAGTATGLCVHAMLAAVGLSAVVMRSAEAFMTVKLIGALYLGRPRHTDRSQRL